jgi:hypothetical protein
MPTMFPFKNTLHPAKIIRSVSILMMLSLTGVTTIGYVYAQPSDDLSSSPSSSDENNNEGTTSSSVENSSTTTITDQGPLSLRGIIGSTFPVQQDVNSSSAAGQATTVGGDYVAAGRWRLVAENGTLDRFVAHFGVAKPDGSSNHDIVIENIGPSFKFTGNSSRALMQISTDGSADPATIVPVSIELHGKVLRITDINIDEGRSADPKQADTLKIIDGRTVYGLIESQGGG